MARQGSSDESTRDIILAAATELFGAKGYDGVHMRDIAERVSLTMPAIYYYFKSKEQLYVAVLTGGGERFRAILEEAARASGSIRDRLVAMVAAHFRLTREFPALMRLFYQALLSPS